MMIALGNLLSYYKETGWLPGDAFLIRYISHEEFITLCNYNYAEFSDLYSIVRDLCRYKKEYESLDSYEHTRDCLIIW